jgi:hypothetical protein
MCSFIEQRLFRGDSDLINIAYGTIIYWLRSRFMSVFRAGQIPRTCRRDSMPTDGAHIMFQTETNPILLPWTFGSHWNVFSDSRGEEAYIRHPSSGRSAIQGSHARGGAIIAQSCLHSIVFIVGIKENMDWKAMPSSGSNRHHFNIIL